MNAQTTAPAQAVTATLSDTTGMVRTYEFSPAPVLANGTTVYRVQTVESFTSTSLVVNPSWGSYNTEVSEDPRLAGTDVLAQWAASVGLDLTIA